MSLVEKLQAGMPEEEPRPKLTEEQELILKTAGKVVRSKRSNRLVIEAGAGTGKTFTLKQLALSLTGQGLYTAFNRPLVNESQEKFKGTGVPCKTQHGLAFMAEGRRFQHRLNAPRMRSDEIAKLLGIKDYHLKIGESEKRLPAGFLAGRVMDAIWKFCQTADQKIGAKHFKPIDGIEVPAEDGSPGTGRANNLKVQKHLLKFARKAWKDLTSEDGQLPFRHDVYVKLWQLSEKPVISADYILVDEAQDTAPVMLDVLDRQKATVIIVGDSAQQIYEWRGAVNALAVFPDAPRCFLSQSFRFGQAVAEVANTILETLESGTDLRLKGFEKIKSRIAPVENPQAILCRTNAVAVSSLLGGIANGKRPYLVGGGADVIAFVKAARSLQRGESTSHPELACFNSWAEVQEYATLDEGEDLKLMVKLIDSFGVEEILHALQSMCKESDADFVISTAHKSKGREWPTVRLAEDFPPESKCGDAERRLLYVAATRAKETLDVSHCPFFNGDDAIDLCRVIALQPSSEDQDKAREEKSIEEKSSTKDQDFTWAKGRQGDWLVRGPKGFSGRRVSVTRRDGSSSEKVLDKEIWTDGEIALYSI